MNRIAIRYKEIIADAAAKFDKHGSENARENMRKLGMSVLNSPLPGAYAYITVGNVRYRISKGR